MKLQERFLSEVFRLGNIPHHSQTERINASLVQGVEMGKCVMVARLSARQNFGLGRERLRKRYLGCRVAKLDHALCFLDGFRLGRFGRLLLKPGTGHALPLGRGVSRTVSRVLLRQASFLVSIRCSSEKV